MLRPPTLSNRTTAGSTKAVRSIDAGSEWVSRRKFRFRISSIHRSAGLSRDGECEHEVLGVGCKHELHMHARLNLECAFRSANRMQRDYYVAFVVFSVGDA